MKIHDMLDLGEIEFDAIEGTGLTVGLSWGTGEHVGRPLHLFYGPDRDAILAWLDGPEGRAYASGWHQRGLAEGVERVPA